MSVDRDNPTFNLKVVVRETGIKADTLRAWERRYGLPDPARTSGGHRLYSQRDIDTLKWLVARQQEGLTISRAVDLWRSLKEEGQDPLLAMPVYIGAAIQPPVISSTSGDVVAELREAWIAACLEFDERRAEEVVTHALSLFPPELVCVGILQEALSEIGEMWYERHLTVQQEHFASALATRRLEALIAASPLPFRPGRIIVACPPHELHVFSTLIVTLLLRRQGWDVLYLGADVPIEKLNETITATNPSLVVLAAQQLHTAATLMQTARALMDMGTAVAFGGRIFNLLPHLSGRIPGHFLGENLSHIPAEVERLVMHPISPPVVDEVPAEYLHALAQFRRDLPLIESTVMNHASRMDIQADHLDIANESLSRGIRAALQLGDTQLLDYDIEWIEGLLVNYDLPPEILYHYLRLYQNTVGEHMAQHGGVVTEMLESLIQRQ